MKILFVFLVFLGVVWGYPKGSPRIAGGWNTTVDVYPYAASVLGTRDFVWYSHECGGTILTPTAILSAAQCFIDPNAQRYQIRVGSSYSSSGGEVFGVQEIIRHPDYNGFTKDNDIAILRTSSAIVYNATIQPASIADATYTVMDFSAVWAIGWGFPEVGSTTFSEQLRHVNLIVMNQAECQKIYSFTSITNNMMCSSLLNLWSNTCAGDTGGPLVHNGVVVGVRSFGVGCGNPHYPSVHTRVSRYADWIKTNTE